MLLVESVYVPPAQSVQVAEPRDCAYVPDTHEVHDSDPVWLLARPGLHCEHVAEPALEYLPLEVGLGLGTSVEARVSW